MTVAVVIPCRNEARHVRGVLDAIAAQTTRPTEVIVVDDASTDNTAEIARAWAHAHPDMRCHVVPGPGRGPGPAMNAGIAATAATVIARMDGHARPAPNYLESAMRWFTAAEVDHVGVVGGWWAVRPGDDSATALAIAAVVSSPWGSGGAQYREPQSGGTPLRVETVPFGVFLREVWATVGGYDESLAVNEDFDFNFRVQRSGRTILLDPAMSTEYFARTTLGQLGRQYVRYGYWKARMLAKDLRGLHPRQVPPIGLVPWLLLTVGWALSAPGWGPTLAAGLWPLVVISAGLVTAVQRRVRPWAAVGAVGTVHLAWSVGFWIGVGHLLVNRGRRRAALN